MKIFLITLLCLVFCPMNGAFALDSDSSNPKVVMETSMGKIVLVLNPEKAPISVENFLNYVRSGFYDGTIFHRVIPGFMIQGGGFTAEFERKPAGRPIQNEADNGLVNARGTIAMARTGEPHSAGSQFFINTVDNSFLDHKRKDIQGWGYAVFGKVVEGMEAVDAISKVQTGTRGMLRDVPIEPVILLKCLTLQSGSTD